VANRTKRTPQRERVILAELAKGATIAEAAAAAGVGRRTAIEWRDQDPDFKAAWEDAYETGVDLLEAEARRRARDGVEKPIYQGGKLVGYTQEYSDSILALVLQAKRKEYRRKVALGGDEDAPPIRSESTLNLAALTPEQRDQLRAILAASGPAD
jgi:hypothetical protein